MSKESNKLIYLYTDGWLYTKLFDPMMDETPYLMKEAAEEFGIFALPTTMIGGVSVTGIPEPDMIMKMILGAKVTTKRGASK